MRAHAPLSERFWPKVEKGDLGQCWPWKASRNECGYGVIGAGGRNAATLKAHRVAWELINGPVPEGMNVLHRCDNPPCCNPGHLFLGTNLDNFVDMRDKGRAVGPPTGPGEKSPSSKWTAADIRAIRKRYEEGGITCEALGRLFGMSKANIKNILSRRTWVGDEFEPDLRDTNERALVSNNLRNLN